MAFVRTVVRRISTGIITNDNWLVNDENFPNLGLDPDLECLVVNEPYPQKVFDARKFKLVIKNEITGNNHPDYPSMKEYLITYSEAKREDTELILSVQQEQVAANESIYNGYRVNELFVNYVAIKEKKDKKEELNLEEKTKFDMLMNMAAKIQSNKSVYDAKVSSILKNEEYSLDSGWIKE